MKTQILSLIGTLLFLNLFSQSTKNFEPKPKDMVFIPQGTFKMKVVENKDTMSVSVSLGAFWMSNEITNREYKEFVNYLKQNPDYKICWVDLEKAVKDRSENSEGMKKYVLCIKSSEILVDIIDTSKLPYNDYFTNKKYDNYPVVGITQRQAILYCNWKTQIEIEKLEKEGKPAIHDYRLPLEEEWAYVANQPLSGKSGKIETDAINPSVSGAPNDWGLYNMAGNVSEWTSSYQKTRWNTTEASEVNKDLKIVRGGSWKTTPNINERKILDQKTKENYIGFRIVRSYVGLKK